MWFEEHGIDTFSFCCKLTSEQKDDIIEGLDKYVGLTSLYKRRSCVLHLPAGHCQGTLWQWQ